MMDMKVYIETDSDIRLARRLKRDIMERGRDLEGVIKQYEKFVKPAFDYYIAPTVVHADLIVPRGIFFFFFIPFESFLESYFRCFVRYFWTSIFCLCLFS